MILADERERAMVLPITQRGRDIAQEFEQFHQRASHLSVQRMEQIRLNTLAVWAVHDYFNLLDVPTNLEQSDSWNPMMQLAGDMADLVVEGLGRVECRPMRAHEERCVVPPETWTARVGYVAVEISEDLKSAKLLGFTPTVETETVAVSALRPLEDLIDQIHHLQETAQVQQTDQGQQTALTPAQASPSVRLGQWLQGMFETGWQQVDQMLTPERLNSLYAFRTAAPFVNASAAEETSGVERAKWIDLGLQLGRGTVALVVQLQPEQDDEGPETVQKTVVTLQLCPGPGEAVLPSGVALQVLDGTGEIFSQTQARDADNLIQLKFRGDRDECFQVVVALDDVRIVESFIL